MHYEKVRHGQKTYYEKPLGTIREPLTEPGPRFIDPYEKLEREAIQWTEREADERIRLEKLTQQK